MRTMRAFVVSTPRGYAVKRPIPSRSRVIDDHFETLAEFPVYPERWTHWKDTPFYDASTAAQAYAAQVNERS